MNWIVGGVLLLVGFLIGIQLFALFKARRIKQTPIVRRLQQEYPDVFAVNVPENIETARRVGVMGTPSIVLIREGTVQEFHLGFQPEARLRSLLAR